MNYFFVLAHPEPQSFNAALVSSAAESLVHAGHLVEVSDLYRMNFDPVSDRRNFTTVKDPGYFKQQTEEVHATQHAGFVPELLEEMKKLHWCDVLVFQFPLWWFGLPAILKGWVDRVFAMGAIYGGGKWYSNGVFRGKRAVCSLTTGGGPDIYAPDGLNGDLNRILFPVNHGIFAFTGFTVVEPFVSWSPARATLGARQEMLSRFSSFLLGIPEARTIEYPPLEAFDERMRLRSGSHPGGLA